MEKWTVIEIWDNFEMSKENEPRFKFNSSYPRRVETCDVHRLKKTESKQLTVGEQYLQNKEMFFRIYTERHSKPPSWTFSFYK